MRRKLLVLAVILLVAGIAGYAGRNHLPTWKESSADKTSYGNNITQTTDLKSSTTQNSYGNKKYTAPTPKNEDVQKTTTTGNLPDKKYGWGIKKKGNHQQPEVPAGICDTLALYDAYWIGDPKEKAVYLTFDEGYENGYTSKILDILKEQNVKSAFFITGHYLKSQPELVKRMVQEGHIVGNHTVNHPCLPDLTGEEVKKEIGQLAEDFFRLTGKKMIYLRPPKGEYSEKTLTETKALGYYNIFWSLALVDWVPMPGGPEEAYQSVMDNVHSGALILLHAVSKDNTESLERIIKDIKAQGYTFKTLDELVKK